MATAEVLLGYVLSDDFNSFFGSIRFQSEHYKQVCMELFGIMRNECRPGRNPIFRNVCLKCCGDLLVYTPLVTQIHFVRRLYMADVFTDSNYTREEIEDIFHNAGERGDNEAMYFIIMYCREVTYEEVDIILNDAQVHENDDNVHHLIHVLLFPDEEDV